ncbi:MAG: ABC transporter permease [Thermoanaerobaculia bacterium]|nr:ABC transporter permease [Thermoanaerobaculia bacterium]
MTGPKKGSMPRWLRLLGPILLLLLPREFRRRYGDDLLLAIDDWRRDRRARGWLPYPLLVVVLLIKTGLAERARPTVPVSGYQAPVITAGRRDVVDIFLQDLKFAWRKLWKQPAFSSLAVLTLAVGVGVNAAVFGILDAVVLQPLPYPEPENLIQMRRTEAADPGKLKSLSQLDVEDIARDAESLESLVGYQTTSVTWIAPDGSPEVVRAGALTSGLLEVFRLAPVEGRDLTSSDNLPTGPRVVVVSQRFADSHLDAAEPAVGSTLRLDGEAFEVVGVAPREFHFPRGAQLWTPLFNDTEGCGRGCRMLTGVGRIAAGHNPEAVAEELGVLSSRMEQSYPEDNLGTAFHARDLQTGLLGGVDRSLRLLMGSVFLVLLIAASNLAGLQMARTSSRRTEFSVRSALGAARGRICLLVLLETLLLGLGGGVIGFLLGVLAMRIVLWVAPSGMPSFEGVGLDSRVFLFSLVVALSSALLLALWPAWRLAARTIGSGVRATGDRTEIRARNWLLVVEVALCLGLLVGAGLLLRTYHGLLEADLGFDPQGLSSFMVALPDKGYDVPEKVISFADRLEAELGSIPGVVDVGSALGRPFSGNTIGTSFRFMDEPEPLPGASPSSRIRIVTHGYLDTLRIPLHSGRDLSPVDRQGAQPVLLVNEEFVRRFSPARDPIGREVEIDIGFGLEELPRTIVGIVGDTLTESITDGVEPELFIPQAQMAVPWLSVVLRTERESPWTEIAAAVQRVDPHLPLRNKETLVEAIDEARGPTRFYLVLMSGFSAIAVFLAAIGLYGVVSHMVTRRSREIAIRMALGAASGRVVRQVLAEGMKTVGFGIALGLVIAVLGTRLLESMLFGVEPLDPLVLAFGVLGLISVSLLALLVPAYRAGRVSATVALKEN